MGLLPLFSREDAMPVLSEEEMRKIHACWRAANYLSVGQIYLLNNPLLKEPLRLEHIKPGLPGHWGATPGLNFIYVHLNRVIRARDLKIRPGHARDKGMDVAGEMGR
jgi:xylulose-5-phosphate/fructose-6-phosphate phosphoketolase